MANTFDRKLHYKRIALRLTEIAKTGSFEIENDGGGGYYTISGSSAVTLNLPRADLVIGSEFAFRNLSDHAHQLSASNGLSGSADAQTMLSLDGVTQGSLGALDALVGSSVILKSNGLQYLVLAGSGSFTVT